MEPAATQTPATKLSSNANANNTHRTTQTRANYTYANYHNNHNNRHDCRNASLHPEHKTHEMKSLRRYWQNLPCASCFVDRSMSILLANQVRPYLDMMIQGHNELM